MDTVNRLRADSRALQQWNAGIERARYDYAHKEHLLAEMLNDWYFGACWSQLRPGDMIWITDGEDKMVVVRVDSIERETLTAPLSLIEQVNIIPVISHEDGNDLGVSYRYRGPRGGAHCIVTATETVAIGFSSKEEAEKQIAIMRKAGAIKAPVGHEPPQKLVG